MGQMRGWVAGAILGWCCVAHADDVLTRVEKLLGAGIEPAGTHEQIAALGDEGEEALWTLYGDPNTARVVRLRALSELARFPTVRTAKGFVTLLRAASAPTSDPLHPARSAVVLRRVLDGLTAIAETVPPGIEAAALQFALTHPDAHVRKAAASLLACLDKGDVDGTLNALVARDPSRMVRTSAQRAMTVRAARLSPR